MALLSPGPGHDEASCTHDARDLDVPSAPPTGGPRADPRDPPAGHRRHLLPFSTASQTWRHME